MEIPGYQFLGTNIGSAGITTLATAVTVIDTAHTLKHATINPIVFLVCSAVGAVFVMFAHLIMDKTSIKEFESFEFLDNTYYASLRCLYSSIISGSVGVLPALALRVSKEALLFLSGSATAGLRCGGMLMHFGLHANVFRNRENAEAL
ncbi:MAG: hypothetical protein H0X51_02180 [Parachlamydiaceae bacterium]|nr:hypothetical protein [Parachlamydiaceae bacterium]